MDDTWLAALPGTRNDEPLDRHSQYGIGGPADWYLKVRDTAHLAEVMRRCHQSGVPLTVIGAGSNSLVLDGGIRGLVVELPRDRMSVLSDDIVELLGGGKTRRVARTTASAEWALMAPVTRLRAMMPRAALDCAARGLGGLEFAIGVPGTCGASVRGNAGAFGTEIKDVLVNCDALAPDGSQHTYAASSTTSPAMSWSPRACASMPISRSRCGR